jgi:hypothetical protein
MTFNESEKVVERERERESEGGGGRWRVERGRRLSYKNLHSGP